MEGRKQEGKKGRERLLENEKGAQSAPRTQQVAAARLSVKCGRNVSAAFAVLPCAALRSHCHLPHCANPARESLEAEVLKAIEEILSPSVGSRVLGT